MPTKRRCTADIIFAEPRGEFIAGRIRVAAHFSPPDRGTKIVTVIDRLGLIYHCFNFRPDVGGLYRCNEVFTGGLSSGNSYIMRAAVLRLVKLAEVRAALAPRPDLDGWPLESGYWCEIHTD